MIWDMNNICLFSFGDDKGEEVWEECNQAFDRLPLAAVIDHEIFWYRCKYKY